MATGGAALEPPHTTPPRFLCLCLLLHPPPYTHRAVSRHGEKNWSTVARTFNQLMGRPPLLGRAPKQCRSRYLQQLVPGIKTGEWSVEEEEILVEGHKQFGNQWTLIASMLPGRTETSVKNHYNCTARRCGGGVTSKESRVWCSSSCLGFSKQSG